MRIRTNTNRCIQAVEKRNDLKKKAEGRKKQPLIIYIHQTREHILELWDLMKIMWRLNEKFKALDEEVAKESSLLNKKKVFKLDDEFDDYFEIFKDRLTLTNNKKMVQALNVYELQIQCIEAS